MKLNKYITAAAVAAMFATSCYEGELYDEGPDWVSDKIAEEAAKKAANQGGGEEEEGITSAEDPYQIGITGDFSNGWWGTFSKYYKLGKGDTLTLKFNNYSDCKANYHNWVGYVTSDVDIKTDGYTEYLGQRADRWDNVLQANAVFTGSMVEELTEDDNWAAWLKTMDNASVTFQVIRSNRGLVTTYSTTTTSDGKEWTCNQETGIATEGDYVRVFIVCEESYVQFNYSNKAGELDPLSTIGEVDLGDDHAPVSISVEGYPTALELGDDDFWKNAVATVTLDNGAKITADKADITFTVVPDLTTVGEKMVVLSYSKTKKGGYAQAVGTSYKLEVTAPINSIEIEAANTVFYYKPGTTTPPTKDDIDVASFIKTVWGKTGSTDVEILASDYKVEVTSVPATMTDKIVITVTYKDFTDVLEVALEEEKYKEVAHGITGDLGATDAGYYASITDAVELKSGETVTFKFDMETAGEACYNGWVVIVKDADNNDKVALRPDNWDNVASGNAGIATFLTNPNGDSDEDWWKNGSGMATITKKANCEITFKYLAGVVSITTKTVANGTMIGETNYDGYTYTTTYSPNIGTETCKVALTIDHAKLTFK